MKKINDKEQAMYIAKRFQKQMLIPKIFLFPYPVYLVWQPYKKLL